jgi:hypothetical protein
MNLQTNGNNEFNTREKGQVGDRYQKWWVTDAFPYNSNLGRCTQTRVRMYCTRVALRSPAKVCPTRIDRSSVANAKSLAKGIMARKEKTKMSV